MNVRWEKTGKCLQKLSLARFIHPSCYCFIHSSQLFFSFPTWLKSQVFFVKVTKFEKCCLANSRQGFIGNMGLLTTCPTKGLSLNAPIATKVVCFSRLLKCLRSLYGKQCGPRSTLFAPILNSSVMLGNYLQQRT